MSWSRTSRSSRDDYYGGYPAYVPVAERAAKAAKQVAALEKKGQKLSPVVLGGTKIASTFWGNAWCKNLESYSDYSNRLPRGRSYVRSGAVIDLQIEPGKLVARVQGSSLYTVTIGIGPVEPTRWKTIVAACSGEIASVVELLQGKLSKAVMEVISTKETGLFPTPRQIKLGCSCPDAASMCKHVAAVLYGVGARLDTQPELLFRLRGADPTELITTAAKGAVLGGRAPAKEKRLGADLASVFGIDLDLGPEPAPSKTAPVAVRTTPAPASTAPAPASTAPARVRATPAPASTAPARVRATPAPAKKTTPAKARAKVPAKPEPAKAATVTATELRLLGVPPATVQYWLTTGVLLRTLTPGVYDETERTPERLARFRARENA